MRLPGQKEQGPTSRIQVPLNVMDTRNGNGNGNSSGEPAKPRVLTSLSVNQANMPKHPVRKYYRKKLFRPSEFKAYDADLDSMGVGNKIHHHDDTVELTDTAIAAIRKANGGKVVIPTRIRTAKEVVKRDTRIYKAGAAAILAGLIIKGCFGGGGGSKLNTHTTTTAKASAAAAGSPATTAAPKAAEAAANPDPSVFDIGFVAAETKIPFAINNVGYVAICEGRGSMTHPDKIPYVDVKGNPPNDIITKAEHANGVANTDPQNLMVTLQFRDAMFGMVAVAPTPTDTAHPLAAGKNTGDKEDVAVNCTVAAVQTTADRIGNNMLQLAYSLQY